MRRLAIEAQRFEFAMRGDQQSAAGRFVRAARLDSHQPVFDEIDASDAMCRRDGIQFFEQRERAELLAIHGDRNAAFESDFDFRRRVRRGRGRNDPLPHGFFGRIRGIFQPPPSWLKCQMLRSRL